MFYGCFDVVVLFTITDVVFEKYTMRVNILHEYFCWRWRDYAGSRRGQAVEPTAFRRQHFSVRWESLFDN